MLLNAFNHCCIMCFSVDCVGAYVFFEGKLTLWLFVLTPSFLIPLFLLFQISEYVQHNDAILLVVVPATQALEISSSRALKAAKEYDAESGLFQSFTY